MARPRTPNRRLEACNRKGLTTGHIPKQTLKSQLRNALLSLDSCDFRKHLWRKSGSGDNGLKESSRLSPSPAE